MASQEDLSAAALLVEKVELEKQLDALQVMLNTVTEQRDGYRAHVESFSVEALRLKEESNLLHAQNASLAEQLSAMEQEQVEVRTKWSGELDQASRQFEEMRQQLVSPADLEAMRLKMVADAEAPWRDRCEKLEAQVESEREAVRLLRRESEAQRTALEATANERLAEIKHQEARHMVVEAELRARLEALHDVSGGQIRGEPTDEVTGRRTARENTELTARNERLLEEIDELRREADGLRAVREQLLQAQAARDAEDQAADRLRRADKESLERKASHLQNELDAATVAHDRLHERVLRLETDARTLRGQLDDAQHEAATEKGAAKTKVAEVQRDVERLKVEMGRRAMEAARRESVLQASRDELAEQLAKAQRDAMATTARARDEEGGKVKKLEAERQRLLKELASQEAAAAAAAARERDRHEGTLGECAALKAELHGAVIEKVTALEEAERLRRRGAADSERLSAVTSELHALRLEHSGVTVALKRLEEGEAAHVAAQERMQTQLHSAVREAKVAKSKAAADVSELASKLHRTRKQWGREKAAMRLVEDKGARRADSLRRENIRNRAEGEKLRAERDAARRGATLSMLSAAGELPADLQTLIASDTALADELKQMKAKAESLQQ